MRASILAFLVLGLVLASAAGASAEEWTFMVYLDGDNNLEDAGIDDFNEMAVTGSNDNISIVVQFDRIPGYDTSHGDWTGTKRFYVTQGMTPDAGNATMDLGEQDMGDLDVLANFTSWAIQNYPADHYMLVLWNHGAGWKSSGTASPSQAGGQPEGMFIPWHDVKGVVYDDTSGSHLSIYDVEWALGATRIETGVTLDILGYDACLMQMTEVAHQTGDLSDIVVGSEETEPWDGWDYTATLQALAADPGMSPAQLAGQIASDYLAFYGYGTLSGVNTTLLASAVSELDSFAQELNDSAQTYANEIAGARGSVQDYYYSDYVDLYHFAELINSSIPDSAIQSAATNLMTWVNASVITEAHGGSSYADSHGLSIYFPESGMLSSYTGTRLAQDTVWDEFLGTYEALGSIDTDAPAPLSYGASVEGPNVTIVAYISEENSVVNVFAYIKNSTGDMVENLTLYDDGAHWDNLASDKWYGNRWGSTAEDDYTVDFWTEDDQGNTALFPGLVQFTTIPFNVSSKILVIYSASIYSDEAEYYKSALSANGYLYDEYNIDAWGEPDASLLGNYTVVVWVQPGAGPSSSEQSALMEYLDNGGSLFISGQDIGWYINSYLGETNNTFYNSYLHATYAQDDVDLFALDGVPGDPITDGVRVWITGGDGADNQLWPSEVDPNGSEAILVYDPNSKVEKAAPEDAYKEKSDGRGAISSGAGGLRFNNSVYKVVYFAFGFEGINTSADRELVMGRVMEWFSQSPTALTIHSPVDQCYGSEVPINATLDAQVAEVGYILDNSTHIVTDWLCTDCSGASTTLNLSDGAYNLTVFATSYLGSPISNETSFIVDTAPPTITAYSPANTTYNTTVINLDVGADEAISSWLHSFDGGGNLTFSPNTTVVVPEGSHSVTFYATDAAGNTASATVHFTVDISPPYLITDGYPQPPNGSYLGPASSTNPIMLLYNDSSVGVNASATELLLDGEVIFNSTFSKPGVEVDSFSLNYTPAEPYGEGLHTASITLEDLAGNRMPEPYEWVFTVDTIPPEVGITLSSPFVGPNKPVAVYADINDSSQFTRLFSVLDDTGTWVTAEYNYGVLNESGVFTYQWGSVAYNLTNGTDSEQIYVWDYYESTLATWSCYVDVDGNLSTLADREYPVVLEFDKTTGEPSFDPPVNYTENVSVFAYYDSFLDECTVNMTISDQFGVEEVVVPHNKTFALMVSAQDKASNFNEGNTTVTSDTYAPDLMVGGGPINVPAGESGNVSGRWVDGVSGLASVQLLTNRTGEWAVEDMVNLTGSENESEFSITTYPADAGSYIHWKYLANDTVDNQEESSPSSFLVTGPNLAFTPDSVSESFRADSSATVKLLVENTGTEGYNLTNITLGVNGTAGGVASLDTYLIPNLSVGESTSVTLSLSGSKGTYSGYLVASSEGLLENKSVPVSVEITSVPQDEPPGGGGGGGGTDPYQVKHSFFELSSGKTNEIDIDGKYVPLTKVEFQVKEGTGKVTFEFKGLDVRPSGTPEPPGDVDRYFTVTLAGTDDSNLQDVEVHFKVNKSWMEESGFNSASLARYSDGAWEVFPGTKTGGDGTYLYYKATVPGFSLFAVTGEQVSEAPEAPKRTGRQKVNRTEVGWNCTPNVLECSGDILYECSSDGMGWEEEVCEHGCSEGACRPGPGLTGMVTGADPSLLMAVIGIVIAAAAVLVVFRLRAK